MTSQYGDDSRPRRTYSSAPRHVDPTPAGYPDHGQPPAYQHPAPLPPYPERRASWPPATAAPAPSVAAGPPWEQQYPVRQHAAQPVQGDPPRPNWLREMVTGFWRALEGFDILFATLTCIFILLTFILSSHQWPTVALGLTLAISGGIELRISSEDKGTPWEMYTRFLVGLASMASGLLMVFYTLT